MPERQIVTKYLEHAGDCEVRRVEFDRLDAKISIYDAYLRDAFYIELSELTIPTIHSQHMQNVIESINISESFAGMNREIFLLQETVASISCACGQHAIEMDAPTLYIEPVAGPSIFAQFKAYRIGYEVARAST